MQATTDSGASAPVFLQRYKIVVSYDGSAYAGWQVQPKKITIAGLLQESFKQTFKLSVIIQGASRTDAGVHALGQVAAFCVPLELDPAHMLMAWQAHLPKDIVIRSLAKVDLDYNPRKKVIQKTYFYHFFLKRPVPFYARYGWYCKRTVDLHKLQACLDIFVGTHDFRSFCTGDDHDTTIRTIDSIHIVYLKRFGCYRIVVRGKSFLRYMIRRIVGAALYAASSENLSPATLTATLAEKNPLQTLPTAAAHGLMLRKIIYE